MLTPQDDAGARNATMSTQDNTARRYAGNPIANNTKAGKNTKPYLGDTTRPNTANKKTVKMYAASKLNFPKEPRLMVKLR